MTQATRCTFLLALLVSLAAPTHGQIFVDTDATGANDGTSWTDAYTDLQTAIDNATSSDEIWIAQGVYRADGGAFTIPGTIDGVEVYGGFESGDSFSDRDPQAHRTILSGDVDDDDVDPDGDDIIEDADPDNDATDAENINGSNNRVLLMDGGNGVGTNVSANVTRATVIDGLTVTAGRSNGDGSGLYCDGFDSGNECSPTLRRIVFSGNATGIGSRGGAIHNTGASNGTASPRIINVTFTGNAAISSGAPGRGGAISNRARNGTASPTITNATFTDNAAEEAAAIINVGGNGGTADLTLTNTTFTGNTATGSGGVVLEIDASSSITNAIFWGNDGGGDGEIAVNNSSGGGPTLSHTIVEGGDGGVTVFSGSVTYLDDSGGSVSFANSTNLDRDPQFAGGPSLAGADGVFGTVDDSMNVAPGSPAIEAGDTAALPADASDLDGDGDTSEPVPLDLTGAARTQDQSGSGTATVNIGAYEAVDPAAPIATTGTPQNVTGTTAEIPGTVNPGGLETTVEVKYFPSGDPSAAQTVTASASPLAAGLLTAQGVTVSLDGLAPNTEYEARIQALNGEGDGDGSFVTFTTASSAPPTATTEAPSSVGATSATLAGTVNPNGAETDVTFEYRTVGASSFTSVTAAESPLTGTTDRSVSASVSGLEPNTDYEGKVVASNSEGSDEGSLETFTTDPVSIALTGGGFGGLDRTFTATPGQADQPVGVFRLTPGRSGVDLTEVSVTPDDPGVTGVDRVSLWISDDNSFDASGDTELASLGLGPQTDLPSPMTFDGFTEGLPDSARYLFVTVTLTESASGEVTGFLENETALTLDGGVITEVNGNSQEGFSNLPLSGSASPLPVEMASFEGTTTEGGVRLRWETASEQNNAGFRVERREASARGVRKGERANGREGAWTEVGFVKGSGTTSEPQTYRFTDADLPYAADSVAYRLRQVDTDGSTSLTDPVTIARSGPEEVQLLGTAPNPARSRATVRYAVPESAEGGVTLRLYDIMGRQVRTVETSAEAGRHEQAIDVGGLSSGVYVLRLQAGGTAKTRKLTVVR